MRLLTRTILLPLSAIALSLPASALAARLHIRPGGYAQTASEVDVKNGTEEYSNGAVNIEVAKSGRTIKRIGVACNTGVAPMDGLPAHDEVTILVTHPLAIGSTGAFSFSGPVTLTPEDTQSELTITTTYTVKGRFQNGRIAVTGTDSSPICEPTTVTRFRLRFDPAA